MTEGALRAKEKDETGPSPLPAWPWWPIVGVALVLPTAATWIYFYALAGSEVVRWIYSGSKVVQGSLVLPWFARRRAERGSETPGEKWPWWLALEIGLAFAFGAVTIGMALYAFVLRDSELMVPAAGLVRGKLADMGVNSPGRFLAMTIFLAGVHSLLEEFYWRWFVDGALVRLMPGPAALATSSLGFMAHHVLVLTAFFPGHWGWVAVFSLAVATGGAAWAWIYRRSGSLVGPWISHLVIDAGIMAIGYDLAFRG